MDGQDQDSVERLAMAMRQPVTRGELLQSLVRINGALAAAQSASVTFIGAPVEQRAQAVNAQIASTEEVGKLIRELMAQWGGK